MVVRWLQQLQESHPYTGSKELGLSSGEEKRRKFFSEVLPADSLGPIGEMGYMPMAYLSELWKVILAFSDAKRKVVSTWQER